MKSLLRFFSLKKLYREHRDTLGSTGQGLIENDQEGEIIAGSELENKWGMSFYLHDDFEEADR
jgi:hypothetical protein